MNPFRLFSSIFKVPLTFYRSYFNRLKQAFHELVLSRTYLDVDLLAEELRRRVAVDEEPSARFVTST